MTSHRHIASSLLAATALISAGCASTMVADSLGANDARADRGSISYFSGTNGSGSLTIRLVDHRAARTTQTIGAADTYNGVLFKLSNTSKLKSPLKAATGLQNGTYSMVFTNLPSDGGAHYSLVAGLFRNVGTPADASDAAYANLDAKVGEGASDLFSLTPGQNKTVTITINAVGALSFDSTSFVLDSTLPTFLSGDNTITMTSTQLSWDNNPQGAELKTYFVDTASQTVTVTVATASIPASTNATISLKVPTVTGTAANYWVFAELASGSTVLSRRSRLVTVEPTASVNVDPSGGVNN